MPAERRSFTATRPVKTERTHEENQERAYIAASRRSDRSLEARIESARRASEIHKKRTGRALRVTEQDVINEEMYEEEDDDLPTQYQRLNAHLHTTSVMFNKKLHDYIATQHGVRNMFMSQYQNPQFQQFGSQFPPQPSGAFPQTNNWLSPTMIPPQQFSQQTSQSFNQQLQPSHTNSFQQQQGVRSSPYHIPQRPQPHQRSASIAVPAVDASTRQDTSTPQDARRLSLPAQTGADGLVRPVVSRGSSYAQQQPSSPHTEPSASPLSGSGHLTPQLQVDTDTPASNTFSPMNFPTGSQMLGGPNPLTMSLPPESQQFVGGILDPNDPRTAMFMSGSEHIAQPFTPTYTYNPNYSPKALKSGGSMTLSMPQTGIKSESITDACAPISSGLYTNDSFLTPGNEGYSAFFDFQSTDFAQPGDEQNNNNNNHEQLVDGSSFVNWD